MTKVVTCIDKHKTKPRNILKLGHDYFVEEHPTDSEFYKVQIGNKYHNFLKARFAPVDSAIGESAKRYAKQNELGEDIKDTKRYALKSDKQLMQVMREDLLSDEEFRGAMKFNIFKYGIRYPKKNGVKDLEKAREYIDELIDFEKEIEANVQKEETNHCDA